MAGFLLNTCRAAIYNASTSNYRAILITRIPGDIVVLAAGTYPTLSLTNLHGLPNAWITITGPSSGSPATVIGETCCNAVEIKNCTYVAIKNLTIDSRGLPGVTGLSAKDGLTNLTHDILIEGNTFIGQGGSQQTDAISTKTPTWGWTIRQNKISGAGTGMYFGNSDGTMPFFASVIENNLIQHTIGYNLQIKYQLARPYLAGMPTTPTSTIIRNNVFLKDDQPSPDGNRPNALVGGFPATGYGSTDVYEIYGNVFNHNPREALLQAEGRVSVHDNIFVDGQYAALAFRASEGPLKVAYAYNNTIYSTLKGIYFSVTPSVDYAVIGNLIFAGTPISGFISNFANNITDTVANAVNYVNAPSFLLGSMDFYPRSTKVEGASLDLTKFASNHDYELDFNGIPKNFVTNTMVFRGAYAGLGVNPGWKLGAAIKPPDRTALSDTLVPSSIACSPATIASGGTTTSIVTLSTTAGAGGLSVPAARLVVARITRLVCATALVDSCR